jgi:hypothetical protein
VSEATDTRRDVAAALCAQWRMIASVSLRPRRAGDGYAADIRLDPVVVKGALEQQGYPRNPAAATKIEERRFAALDQCVRRVNASLPSAEQIKSFSVVG